MNWRNSNGFALVICASLVIGSVFRERQGASRRLVRLPDLLTFMPPVILAFSPVDTHQGETGHEFSPRQHLMEYYLHLKINFANVPFEHVT